MFKGIVSVLVLTCLALIASAQTEGEYKEPSKESQAYHEQRMRSAVPSFGLAKVKEMIKGLTIDEQELEGITAKQWASLSFREKFTYCMIHGEMYSQNCDVQPPVQDEHKKIFAFLPDAFNEYSFSERQLNFLKSNKDSVLKLIGEAIDRTGYLGLNYKHVILEVNGISFIPKLIGFYSKSKKDGDILTVLNLLMRKNEYIPFLESATNKKLYGQPDSYYQSFISYNEANEALIIKRAMAFYNL